MELCGYDTSDGLCTQRRHNLGAFRFNRDCFALVCIDFVYMCMIVLVVVITVWAVFDTRSFVLLVAVPVVRDVSRSSLACVLNSFSKVIRLFELQVIFRGYFCSPVESLD